MPKSKISIEESQAFIQTFDLKPAGSGPLNGLKFAIKDNIDVKGFKTGYGNPTWLKTHPVAVEHAICVEQILQAGGECIGKTITSELAFAIDGENHFYGTPLNPQAPDRLPGGSSSGSASAVACGVVDFALGTDTGGSVRVPASNCGIFGMRPSHDVISLTGTCPFASSFDTIGFFANSSDILLTVGQTLLAREESKMELGHIYFIKEVFETCDEDVLEALKLPIEKIKKQFGSKAIETSLGELLTDPEVCQPDIWLNTFRVVQWAEIWTSLGSWIQANNPEFGARTQNSFNLAKSLDRSKISSAIRKREKLYGQLKKRLGPNDLLCFPTTPALAPIKGSLGLDRNKGTYFPRIFAGTAIAGIGRLPQISLPLGHYKNVPVGLSLIGANQSDTFLLQIVDDLCKSLFVNLSGA
jgi:amidase